MCGVETEADLDKVLAPTIKFEIKVENVTIGYTNNFVKAFAMLSTYYVFIIAYAEKSKPVYFWSRNYFLRSQTLLKFTAKVPLKYKPGNRFALANPFNGISKSGILSRYGRVTF